MPIHRAGRQRRRLALGLVAMASVLAVVAVDLPGSSAGRAPVLVRAFPAPARDAGPRPAAPDRPHGSRRRSGRRDRRVSADRVPRIDHLRLSESSPSRFMALYKRASTAFGVSWRLVASIHEQETSFSSAVGTYRGLNFARCCAGPMQFNVANGPVSTWDRFSGSFRRAERPARYPHRMPRHPSVYDDFDAIMAAAALLRASGAGVGLDGAAWRAAYDYYGHDETGLGYADRVLARAVGWTRRGLCVRCAVDPRLVSEFDADFAGPYRAALLAEARRERAAAARHSRHRRHRAKAGDRAGHRHHHGRRRAKHTTANDPAPKADPAGSPVTPPPPTAPAAPSAPASPPPAAPAPAPAPAPPATSTPAPPPALAPAAPAQPPRSAAEPGASG